MKLKDYLDTVLLVLLAVTLMAIPFMAGVQAERADLLFPTDGEEPCK